MKYTIRNKKNPEKTKSLEILISEVDQWEKDNPNWEIVIGAPLVHTGGGLGLKSMRTDESFRSRLKQIDKAFPGNTLRKSGAKF